MKDENLDPESQTTIKDGSPKDLFREKLEEAIKDWNDKPQRIYFNNWDMDLIRNGFKERIKENSYLYLMDKYCGINREYVEKIINELIRQYPQHSRSLIFSLFYSVHLANFKIPLDYLDAIINSYRVQMGMPLYSKEVIFLKRLLSFVDPIAMFDILIKSRSTPMFTCEQKQEFIPSQIDPLLRVNEYKGVPLYMPLTLLPGSLP